MEKRRFKLGDYLAVCDVCGFEYYASQLVDRWDGAKVCRQDWEPRHPSDFIKPETKESSPPWTSPEPEDTFTTVPYIGEPDVDY